MCPFCQSPVPPRPAGFTWWGGLLGPKLLSHVYCASCGKGYNGKTNQPNTTGIIIYSVVVGVIALAVFGLLFSRL
jgi:hypothetical protein